jgi:hypothetical protein
MINLSTMVKNIFISLFFFIAFIPYPTIFSFPIKNFLFLFLIVCLLISSIKFKIKINNYLFYIALFLFICSISINFLVTENFIHKNKQFLALNKIWFFILISKLIIDSYSFNSQQVLRILFLSSYAFCVLKIILLIIFILFGNDGLNNSSLLLFSKPQYKYTILLFFSRIYYAFDYLLPLIFFILNCRYFSKFHLSYNLFLRNTIFVIAILISYSRGVYLLFFISLFFLYLLNYKKVNTYILFFLVPIVFYFFDLKSALVNRFLSQDTLRSDSVRQIQLDFFINNFSFNSLFFGKGIGFYDQLNIRDINQYYNYELQFLYLLLQIGIVPLLLYIFIILSPIKIRYLNNKNILFLFLLVILYFSLSLTNPILINNYVVFIFVLLSFVFKLINEQSYK